MFSVIVTIQKTKSENTKQQKLCTYLKFKKLPPANTNIVNCINCQLRN